MNCPSCCSLKIVEATAKTDAQHLVVEQTAMREPQAPDTTVEWPFGAGVVEMRNVKYCSRKRKLV